MIFPGLVVALFTAIYALMLASTAWEDLLTGVVLSAVLLAIFRPVILPSPLPSTRSTIRVLVAGPRYLWMMVRDILVGTWTVTKVVTGLNKTYHPGIITIPIGDHSERAVGVAGLCLTLSPGSFLLDVDWDQRVMLIHVIDATNWEQIHDEMLEYFTLLDAALNPEVENRYPELPGGRG
ncbi:MAG: Na+/H+ antiporter subunit E [Thermomicrobiales bacterium]